MSVPRFEQFDGYFHPEMVVADRTVDGAHATLADQACNAIRADPTHWQLGILGGVRGEVLHTPADGAADQALPRAIGSQ